MYRGKLLIIIMAFCLFSCGNPDSSGTTGDADSSKAVATVEDTTNFSYDASTDGMLVAPNMTKILGDTLGIKMYEVTAQPGDSIPLHQHPDHAFYVISGGKAAIYFDNDRQEWDLKPGMGFVNGPVNDAAKNIGKTTIKFLVVDVYRQRPSQR